MKRVEIVFKGEQGLIKSQVSKELAGVLYVNGEDEKNVISWISHYVTLKDGKGKDILSVPVEYQVNEKTEKGITTKIEKKVEKVPLNITVTIKNIGKQKIIQRRTGKMIRVRVPFMINAENIVDPENWERLTEKEQEHLSVIDVWAVYDELIKWLGSKNRKPSSYAGALQQIYNRTERETKEVPETEEVKLNSLVDVDIDLTVISKDFTHTFHFDKGSYEKCKGNIVRSFAFVLPRDEIIKGFIKGKFLYETNIMRRHKR